MEKINIKVKGMSCTNCALTIQKYLEDEGVSNIKVNFMSGDVSFEMNGSKATKDSLKKGISKLGYRVVDEHHDHSHHHEESSRGLLANNFQRFIFCAIFALPLFISHIVHIHFLMNPWVQLALTIPVYVVGMSFFGRNAYHSLMKGVPNMDILVTIGSSAAFIYSIIGTFFLADGHQYMFYETTAVILTLVFLGNWLEDKSIETTQASLNKLVVSQKIMANMIAFDDQHREIIFPVESTDLKVGDLILIKSGEYVPMDCKILSGDASANEAIITGESIPVEKRMNDKLIGGSILENGTIKAQVTAVGEDTVMNQILQMVKDAQAEKPPMQQMADKISAIFVPLVLGIAVVTLLANYFIGNIGFTSSLLRSIAVLVIACPCAMGLATPAAIAVGMGRAARNGILFKNARSLEVFKNIKQVVFDKTGTLTTGKFRIDAFKAIGISEEEFKSIAYSLEKFSNHPIAKCISLEWKSVVSEVKWASVEEIKGMGMKATGKDNMEYKAVSFKGASNLTDDGSHNVYILRNNELLGWIDVQDDIRPEAAEVVSLLKEKGIKTILLSGDRKDKCEKVAQSIGIDEVRAEQTPEEKLQSVAAYNNEAPTAMIGDGINDAPALAKAAVGISLSDASQIAIQSAQVILVGKGLKNVPMALGLGKQTYNTIKGNLFWAFFYNIIAIPVAAFGLLVPTLAALVMGLSDVVLAINSVWLNWKKVV